MPQFTAIEVHYGLNEEITVTITPHSEPNQYKFVITSMHSTVYEVRVVTCSSAQELLVTAQELACTVLV